MNPYRPPQRNKGLLFWVLPLFLIAGFAYYLWKGDSFSSSGKDINMGTVTREDLVQRVTVAGVVVPNRKTMITAPYNGYVKKIYVKVGDVVKQGDPVATVVQSLQANELVYPLRAPVSGTVVKVGKTEGEFVKEADPTEFIARIDDISKLFVAANAPEIDRVKMKEGQTVIIKASAILGKSYAGVIRDLALASAEGQGWGDSNQVAYPVKIEITQGGPDIMPGMSVVIDIITNQKSNVLALRHEFIHKEGEEYFVILKDGKKAMIKVGEQNEEIFEIVEGLQEGDQVKQVDFSALAP